MKAPRVMLGTGFVVAKKATAEHCGKCPSDLKKKKKAKKKGKTACESVVTPVTPQHTITINQKPALGNEQPAVTEKKKWMQDVKIKRKGICTGEKLGSQSCPAGSPQYALAKTFKKTAAKGGRAAAKKK